jgi:hypothetical protein
VGRLRIGNRAYRDSGRTNDGLSGTRRRHEADRKVIPVILGKVNSRATCRAKRVEIDDCAKNRSNHEFWRRFQSLTACSTAPTYQLGRWIDG